MKKVLIVLAVCLFLFANTLHAATVYLNSGRKITGKLVEVDDQKVTLSVSGIQITYYKDEIARTEGISFLSEQPEVELMEEEKAQDPAEISERDPIIDQAMDEIEEDEEEEFLSDQQLAWQLVDVLATREVLRQNFETQLTSLLELQKITYDQAAQIRASFDLDEMAMGMIPIYKKHLSTVVMKDAIKFFESSSGKAYLKAIPLIMEENVRETLRYFKKKFPK